MIVILYSALIMLGVGVLVGVLLALFGKYFTVERDPRIDDVFAKLAGVNCGTCGYPGCDAFAEALVKGEATVDKCNPTPKEKKSEIAGILGADAGELEDSFAVVLCNGGNNALNKYSYQGYGNCRTSQILAEGSKFCPVGCMGLADCVNVCRYNAVEVTDTEGYAKVCDKNCVSCGACVSACPKKLITRIPQSARFYVACNNHAAGKEVRSYCSAGCIGCGICARTCKYQAINLVDKLAVIDYKKCVACGECVKVCPTKVIKDKQDFQKK